MNVSFGNAQPVKEKSSIQKGKNVGTVAGLAYGVIHSIKNKEDIFIERAKQGAEVLGSYKKGMAIAIGTRLIIVAGIVAACRIVGSVIGKVIDNKKQKMTKQVFADIIQQKLNTGEYNAIQIKDLDSFGNGQ